MKTTVNNLSIEQMRAIVEGAPEGATTVRISLMGDQFLYGRCENSVGGNLILIDNLRTAIAEHDATLTNEGTKQLESDDCTDIRNHLSPNCKVMERNNESE